jgi:DNA-binding NtrC family response regulator
MPDRRMPCAGSAVNRWKAAADRSSLDSMPRTTTAATGLAVDDPGAWAHLGLVGQSPALLAVFARITKVSRYRTNVLLLGDSGTGKELIARALHASGPRRAKLFVPLNCATLGREILENELFGHERGAFTGADERKKGLLELADGGTLFLDEIGEMDPSTQAKILRVLERHEFRRVGGMSKIKVDLSIIAATNRNLEEAIATGQFREDLYYRLKVVTLVVPPLRERREDIPALVDAFVADFNRRHDGKIRGVTPHAMAMLMARDWPGNVRELKHVIESAAILAGGDTIETIEPEPPGMRPARGRTAPPELLEIAWTSTLPEVERRLIEEHVRRAPTKAEAARTLGIGLRTLYTKLRQFERSRRSK